MLVDVVNLVGRVRVGIVEDDLTREVGCDFMVGVIADAKDIARCWEAGGDKSEYVRLKSSIIVKTSRCW